MGAGIGSGGRGRGSDGDPAKLAQTHVNLQTQTPQKSHPTTQKLKPQSS